MRMFDSRIVGDQRLIPNEAMFLFYSNKDRDRFNKKRVEQGVAGVYYFVNKCEDEAKGLEAGCRKAQRTLRLMSKAKEQ